MNEQEMKDWINNASYEDLLRKNRMAPIGDPFFQPPVGKYFMEVMKRKKEEVGPAAAVAASKKIG